VLSRTRALVERFLWAFEDQIEGVSRSTHPIFRITNLIVVEKHPPDGKSNNRWWHFGMVAQKHRDLVVEAIPESSEQFTSNCIIEIAVFHVSSPFSHLSTPLMIETSALNVENFIASSQISTWQ
jgi:hypothetical protein